MGEWVQLNTCGSCADFDYEGENHKGYCRRYGAYYWPDDSCRNYHEKGYHGGGTGCYLTTACCEHKGLPDDCYELQLLRNFRDTELIKLPNGQKLIERYYRDAPNIVEAINQTSNCDEIYEMIYNQIKETITLIENNEIQSAIIQYMLLTYDLAHIAHSTKANMPEEKL